MSLVVKEEWELEAERINSVADKGWFAVLDVEPETVTIEGAKEAFEGIKKRLVNKVSIRTAIVQRAKQILDSAWGKVGDAKLLRAAQEKIQSDKAAKYVDAGLMEAVRLRTISLEARAAAIVVTPTVP
jgi:hypothetical protein